MDIDNLNTVSSNNYRILGVDPGTYKMGVGIIEKDGTDITFNHSEVIEAGKLVLPNRLKLIYNRLTEVIKDFRPKDFKYSIISGVEIQIVGWVIQPIITFSEKFPKFPLSLCTCVSTPMQK